MSDRAKLEAKEQWFKWMGMIPYISFPKEWHIAIIPPFSGAMTRFRVRTHRMPEDRYVSVYLDCLDHLGSMGHPYFEVYPAAGKDEIFRCSISETKELLKVIQKAIDQIEKEDKG